MSEPGVSRGVAGARIRLNHVIPSASVAAFSAVMLDATALTRVDCAAGYDNAVSEQSSPFRSIGFGSQVIASAGFRASTYVSRAVALAFVAEVTKHRSSRLTPAARRRSCVAVLRIVCIVREGSRLRNARGSRNRRVPGVPVSVRTGHRRRRRGQRDARCHRSRRGEHLRVQRRARQRRLRRDGRLLDPAPSRRRTSGTADPVWNDRMGSCWFLGRLLAARRLGLPGHAQAARSWRRRCRISWSHA